MLRPLQEFIRRLIWANWQDHLAAAGRRNEGENHDQRCNSKERTMHGWENSTWGLPLASCLSNKIVISAECEQVGVKPAIRRLETAGAIEISLVRDTDLPGVGNSRLQSESHVVSSRGDLPRHSLRLQSEDRGRKGCPEVKLARPEGRAIRRKRIVGYCFSSITVSVTVTPLESFPVVVAVMVLPSFETTTLVTPSTIPIFFPVTSRV